MKTKWNTYFGVAYNGVANGGVAYNGAVVYFDLVFIRLGEYAIILQKGELPITVGLGKFWPMI